MLPFLVTCSAPRPLPSAASHYFLGLPQKSRKSSVMNTYKKCVRKPFRMNTYKTLDLKSLCFQHLQKIGGGGWGSSVNQNPESSLKEPRLLRPFARNLFQSRIMFPQRLRHFHLLALQRRD